ncbi:Alkaline phosphatase precursor [Botrimarina mediterranea]|uniref:Alkaline phosphatase n=2 Tax=Botrimarina mediterranea TaxID=2528022 RepID=A0A518KBP4_9BACT|nr:Alkaline phosphatase precursor [Botrimarina mediterranea]
MAMNHSLAFAWLSLAALASTSDSWAQEVTRGPYLQLATPRSVVVVLRTNQAIDPVVRYGTSREDLSHSTHSDAVTVRLSADVAATSDAPYGSIPVLYDEPDAYAGDRKLWDRNPSTPEGTWQYEAKVAGLKPATKYWYAVYDGDRLLAGGDGDHTFTTPPSPSAPADLRLWVVGDSGTGGPDQKRVYEAMQDFAATTGRTPDAVLHVGDMAYGDGADVEFQRHFFDVYQPTLCNTVCWPAMGNHEGHTSRGLSQFGPYYDAYVLPTAGEAGGLASGSEAYYAFDFGRVHFICLDSHDLDRSPDGAMARWLEADLEENDSDWLIAFWHHPPYTKGSHDSDHETALVEMREHIMPLLEAHGVDVVLSGHSHIYERSMLIDGAYATPTVSEGVVLDDGDGDPKGDGAYRKSAGLRPHNGSLAIVSGHGGGGVGRKGTMPIMREIIVEHGSLLLDIKGDTLTGTMVNKHGAVRDEFQLVKRGKVEHTPITNPWRPAHDPDLITEMRLRWREGKGGQPQGWSVLSGEPGRFEIERREDLRRNLIAVTSTDQPLLITSDRFEGKIGELEAHVQFTTSVGAAGLAFACESADRLFAYVISPETREALLVQVIDGERTVVGQRSIDLPFDKPIKIELEPSPTALEVQLNDDLEYTVPLPEPFQAGRVGVVLSEGTSVQFSDLVVERAK